MQEIIRKPTDPLQQSYERKNFQEGVKIIIIHRNSVIKDRKCDFSCRFVNEKI